MAGLLGGLNADSPMGALGNLLGGLVAGQRQDKQGIANQQQEQARIGAYQAVRQAGG